MIIGISGKIGSGKDTVGRIIRYLTMCNVKQDYTEKQFNEFTPFLDKSKWEIKKFADRLKECASLILNIPREDLEKIEVKNRELEEEWQYHKQNNRTVRDFLQQFGTNACRDQVHPNFWVNALFSEYKDKIKINEFTNKPTIKLGELIPLEVFTSKHYKIKYRCFCGKLFKTTPYKVEIDHTKSCGCYARFRAGETQYKDGRKGSRLWNIYNNMIQRCENPNQPRYKDYGGRGITVSDSFKSFENFKIWAEHNGYDGKLTLDRIEVNDIYCPDNCRFTTTSIQAINARKRNDNTSGYRGVSFETKENKWRANIQIDGHIKFLGYFDTPESASIEYEKWYKIREDKYLKRITNVNTKNWIITDMRFENELESVKSRGGITIRVNRPDESDMQADSRNHHPSETALDNATFDHIIENDGSIEELIIKVKEILIKEKIL